MTISTASKTNRRDDGKWIKVILLKVSAAMTLLTASGLAMYFHVVSVVYLRIVNGSDHGALLQGLFVVGLMFAMVCLIGAVLSYKARNPEGLAKIRNLLYVYLIWAILFIFVSVAISVLIVLICLIIEPSIQNGFSDKMVNYLEDSAVHQSIDAIQKDFRCCGNYNYSEWYLLTWSNSLDKDVMGVPSSCCDVVTSSALNINCVTTLHFSEIYRITPYKVGCVNKLASTMTLTLQLMLLLFIFGTILASVGVVLVCAGIAAKAGKNRNHNHRRENGNSWTRNSNTQNSNRWAGKGVWDMHTPSKLGYYNLGKKSFYSEG